MRRAERDLGMPLGTYLEDRYLVRRWTQRRIGRELGISNATVCRWLAFYEIESRLTGQRGNLE